MKKLIISSMIAGIILASGSAFAQEKKEAKKDAKATTVAPGPQPGKTSMAAQQPMNPEKRAEQAVNRIAEKVKDLNAEQKKKLTEIHIASFTQADKERDLAKTDMEKFKEVSKTRVLKMRDDIKGVLNEAQWKIYTTPTPRPDGPPTGDKKDAPKQEAPKQEIKK